MLHQKTVTPQLLELLRQLMQLDSLKKFRLVGGTSLALQIGHRESIDIDLFTDTEFKKNNIILDIRNKFSTSPSTAELTTGLNYEIKNIKVDIFNWGVPFLRPAIIIEGIRMASMEDIVAMKLEAIITRGSKKDYWDIAYLLDYFSFKSFIDFFKSKYNSDPRQVIENILLFERAEKDPNPKIFNAHNWSDIKNKISIEVKKYVAEELKQ